MLSLKARALAGSGVNAVMMGAAFVSLCACAGTDPVDTDNYTICDDSMNSQCAEPQNIIVEDFG